MSDTKIIVMTEKQVEELIKRTIRDTLSDRANFQHRWLTINEACEYLKVSRWSLDQRTRQGKIPVYRDGGLIRYLASDLDDVLLNSRE